MKKVKIYGSGESFEVEEELSLLDGLLNQGYFVDNSCNGMGTCGKCLVKIRSGNPNPISPSEQKHIKKADLDDGKRLSCYIRDWDEIEVELIEKEREGKILTEGYMPDFKRDYREGYGICLDIGTTTLALSLVDLKTGEILADASMVNTQKNYGLDVLTRISYANENPDGLEKLQKSIVGAINSMIGLVCKERSVSPTEIVSIVVAANTTMDHFLLGVDPSGLGRYPYKPAFTDGKKLKASEIGIEAGEDTVLYTLPHVSAFIGSDVVCGVYVFSKNEEIKDKNILFIDIGTNGEIVLSKKGELYGCSCAAGPALEGMNISCGMRAASGAIEDVFITREGIKLKVIDDTYPVGICGSGILALVKELLRTGTINKNGALVKKEDLLPYDYRRQLIKAEGKAREFIIGRHRNIYISQADIRQVQLAKGAILSGFVALVNAADLTFEDIDLVYVAGQFGSYLKEEFLVGTGILPKAFYDKIEYLGNSSKTGAYMALMSDQVKEDLEDLAKKVSYIELASTENYERIFIDSLAYPDFKDGEIVD
ncbi:MAG: ASKHA domain-containing protein [Finegoldia sp.]|nr:ASKHA domain-containing protein [Finegoldia sp.]